MLTLIFFFSFLSGWILGGKLTRGFSILPPSELFVYVWARSPLYYDPGTLNKYFSYAKEKSTPSSHAKFTRKWRGFISHLSKIPHFYLGVGVGVSAECRIPLDYNVSPTLQWKKIPKFHPIFSQSHILCIFFKYAYEK